MGKPHPQEAAGSVPPYVRPRPSHKAKEKEEKVLKPLEAEFPLTVKQLAAKISMKPSELIKILMKKE